MIRVIATGSNGNLSVASDGHTRLLVECGFPVKRIRELTGYSLTDFDGCLLTHEHLDHARSAVELGRRGVPVFATHGTLAALADLDGVGVGYRESVTIGSITVMAMPVSHDAAMPCAWGLRSEATGATAFYITDTCAPKFTVRGVHQLCVECNYSEARLRESDAPEALADRIRCSHMSVEGLEAWLRKCDLSNTRVIRLIHLSQMRGDPEEFATRIHQLTGIKTEAEDFHV